MYTSGLDQELASAIDSTQTTGIIISPRSINSVNTAWTASSGVVQVIEEVPGTVKVEWMYFTSITTDGNNNVTLNGVVRNISTTSNTVTTMGPGKTFSRGAKVKLVVDHRILNAILRNDADGTTNGKITFNKGFVPPVFANNTARDIVFPAPWIGLFVVSGSEAQIYYNGIWRVLGTATISNAANGVAGMVDIATGVEIGAGTAVDATSGAINVIPVSQTVKISSGSADENKLGVLNQDGQYSGGFTGVFPGIISPYAGSTAPLGWLLCFGQAVSRTTFSALFSIIGTTYGTGDGSTTFNVPDLRGRFPLGKDDMGGTAANRVTAPQADNLGQSSGAESHALTGAEVGPHIHGQRMPATSAGNADTAMVLVGVGGGVTGSQMTVNSGPIASKTQIFTDTAGSGTAHNNMSPYITLNYIIKS